MVFTRVPEVGNVTSVVPLVVSVKLLPPEVISEELFASVNVAAVAGVEIVTLFTVEADTAPLERTTPETEEATEVPVNKDPPIPTPPVTTNAPEFVAIDTCVEVKFTVPPINAFPTSPNPPDTTNPPVPVEVDEVLDSNLDGKATYRLPPIPVPPETTNAPVELLTAGDDP